MTIGLTVVESTSEEASRPYRPGAASVVVVVPDDPEFVANITRTATAIDLDTIEGDSEHG